MIRDHEMLMKFSIFWAPLKIFLFLYIPNVIIKRKKNIGRRLNHYSALLVCNGKQKIKKKKKKKR